VAKNPHAIIGLKLQALRTQRLGIESLGSCTLPFHELRAEEASAISSQIVIPSRGKLPRKHFRQAYSSLLNEVPPNLGDSPHWP
jgi:hypothetical protein